MFICDVCVRWLYVVCVSMSVLCGCVSVCVGVCICAWVCG